MYRENYRLRTNLMVVAILREKQLCCITLLGHTARLAGCLQPLPVAFPKSAFGI